MRRFTKAAVKVLNTAAEISKSDGCPFTGSEHVLRAMLITEECTAYKILSARGITGQSAAAFTGFQNVFSSRVDDGGGYSVRLRHILDNACDSASCRGDGETGTEHILLAMVSEDECAASRIITEHGVKPAEIFSDVTQITGVKSRTRSFGREVKTGYLKQYGKDLCRLYEEGGLLPCVGRQKECERIIRILCRRTKNNPCLLGEAGVGKTAVAEAIAGRIAEGDVPDMLYGKTVISVDVSSLVSGTKYRGDFEERMRGVIAEAEYRGDVILFFDELHTVIGAGAAEGAVDASNILKQPLGRGDITVIGATTYGEYEKYVENDPALSRRFQPVFINEPDEKLAFSMLCGVRPEFERHHNVKITDGALSEAVRLSKKYIKNRALPDKAIDLIDEAAAGARSYVTEDDIKKTLSVMSCGAEDITALKDLRARLEQTVFGQSAAIKTISGALIKSFSLLSDGLGPKASFLFKGPESVGKTAVCRALADILYPGKNAFFRFDMSEYTEPHSVSRLIGAPPGYSGCHDGGSLTECVRRHPCSVICVSDIEYAHGDVLSLFAEILDKGELTDSRGRTVDFSGAVIIFTSNCGGGKASGFCRGDDAVPEKSPLDGRVCRVVNFSPLCAADLQKIIERRLSRLKELCRVPLTVDENSAAALALKCADKNARAALEAVGEFIEEPLSAMLLEPGVMGADIKTNGKDITVSSVKTLDKPLVMEYN